MGIIFGPKLTSELDLGNKKNVGVGEIPMYRIHDWRA